MSHKKNVQGVGSSVNQSDSVHILSLDVGTTTIRAHVYDSEVKIVGTGSRKVLYFI